MKKSSNFGRGTTIEEQLKTIERVELPGGEVEVIDIKPEKKKTNTPVILGVGWGGEPEAYEDNIISLVKTGRRTISIDAVHGVDHKIDSRKVKDLPDVELRKVAALIEVLDYKKISKVDAVGYSEGGIYITLAAMLYPKKFRNLVLVNPGGMIGKDQEFRLTIGFLRDLVKHFVEALGNRKFLKRFGKFYGYIIRSIFLDINKAMHEISAISDTQIQKFLKKVKKHKIGISVIYSIDDHVFPIDRIQEITDQYQIDSFYSVKGAHADFVIKAEAYMQVVDKALDDLENKK